MITSAMLHTRTYNLALRQDHVCCQIVKAAREAMAKPGPACTMPIFRLPIFAMKMPSVPATTNPATMRIYAIAMKCPCFARRRIDIPVASCRVAMSVTYDLKSGVSCCSGIEIPDVLLNAIGSMRACAPVKTEAVAKMREMPLKMRNRSKVVAAILRAVPWLRCIA